MRTLLKQLSGRAVWVVAVAIWLIFYTSAPARAEEKLSLTITPPLFQLAIGPGEVWQSSLKVVNTNPYDLTVYASLMDFEAQGEDGQGRFIPILEKNSFSLPPTASLASWIKISNEPIVVPTEKSMDIPFSVSVPSDAQPGGHYAAILIGTAPLAGAPSGSVIKISSAVSSLFFARVKGDILEEGNIREFFTKKIFYQQPDVEFVLRFENSGNVHLLPQGEIVIYDMWGKEKGRIPINQNSDSFGNVLPRSVRKFNFLWQRDESIWEAGRYTAVATLSFGQNERQNISYTTSFWFVPLKPVLLIFGILVLIVLFTFLIIRSYIRRSLARLERKLKISTKAYHK